MITSSYFKAPLEKNYAFVCFALVMEIRDPCDDNKLVQSILLQGQAKRILVATLIHFLPFCNELSTQIRKI